MQKKVCPGDQIWLKNISLAQEKRIEFSFIPLFVN